jgi:hypothetical protein
LNKLAESEYETTKPKQREVHQKVHTKQHQAHEQPRRSAGQVRKKGRGLDPKHMSLSSTIDQTSKIEAAVGFMTVRDDCNKSNGEAIDEAAVLVDLREAMYGICDSRAARNDDERGRRCEVKREDRHFVGENDEGFAAALPILQR